MHYKNLDMADMEGEIWKPIIQLPTLYEISNYGRIKSVGRTIVLEKPQKRDVVYHPKIMCQYVAKTGYILISLTDYDGSSKSYRVHKLLAEAFLPNPENKKTVDHLNGDKTDNRLENLRWATQKEQEETIKRLGSKKIKEGAAHAQSKTVYHYDLRGNYLATYGSCGEASRKTGFSSSQINKVCTKQFDFLNDYVFSYTELPKEWFNREFRDRKRKKKEVIQYDLNGVEIKRHFNATEAAEEVGSCHSNVHYACIGRIKTCMGYIWKYAEDVEASIAA